MICEGYTEAELPMVAASWKRRTGLPMEATVMYINKLQDYTNILRMILDIKVEDESDSPKEEKASQDIW